MKLAGKLLALAAVLALPALASETKNWQNVSLVDLNCSKKAAVTKDPDTHTRDCALLCSKSGYGVLVDGKYYKFDAAGSDQALAALKASSKKDHLRVDVSGELDGDTLTVASLKLLE
jgi:hypothetical protein